MTHLTCDGAEVPLAGFKATWTINGNRSRSELRFEGRGTCRLVDPKAKPNAMIVILDDGPSKGKEIPGIYKFEDDTWTECQAKPGNPGPTEFATGAEAVKGRILIIWKRVQP